MGRGALRTVRTVGGSARGAAELTICIIMSLWPAWRLEQSYFMKPWSESRAGRYWLLIAVSLRILFSRMASWNMEVRSKIKWSGRG